MPRTEVMVMMPVSTATQHSPVHVCAEGRSHSKGLTYTCTEKHKQNTGLIVRWWSRLIAGGNLGRGPFFQISLTECLRCFLNEHLLEGTGEDSHSQLMGSLNDTSHLSPE